MQTPPCRVYGGVFANRHFSSMKKWAIALMMFTIAGAANGQKALYDINRDNNVDVSDVTVLVNRILNNQQGPLGDINKDGCVDVVDVTMLVDYILGKRQINGHDYIDLGLPSGTLWATCNIGASSPEDDGEYYAWGEIAPKSSYTWSNYILCDGSDTKLNRYNSWSGYGKVDNLSCLLPADDVAQVLWGGTWQIPTGEQADELKSNCTWTRDNALGGYKVTGPNGNSIFMPMAGYMKGSTLVLHGNTGYYWTSTLDYETPHNAICILVDNSMFSLSSLRNAGRTIRPVAK